jgi:ribosomal protein S18 acetylase RimI-like enzyme
MSRDAKKNAASVTQGKTSSSAGYRIRRANLADLPTLVALEQQAFTTDHLSRRQYRHHLQSDSARVLAAVDASGLLGKAVVFFRKNTAVARLYSIAVAHTARGRGVGEALLSAAERAVRARGYKSLRLEVRQDNAGAIRLYERLGYHRFGAYAEFYEDGAPAWRYEKNLR